MHRQNRPARAAWLLGALPAVALLAACSTGPGPLGDGGSDGIQCLSFPQGKPVTVGLYDLANAGQTTVTIQHIELPADSGLTMGKTWLVPIYHDPGNGNFVVVGVGAPYPPTTAPEWPDRRPAIGATIRPGQDLNLVFPLTRTTAKAGKSRGPMITYAAGGSDYSVSEKTSMIVAENCTSGP